MKFSPRTVENNVLISKGLPALRIQISPQFTYVGSIRFPLYNAAHVEQHHFVIPDAARRVERLLWFQFEGYFDTNEYKYQYSIQDTLTLGGLTFLYDADTLNIDNDYKERPSSDSAHVVDFLKQEGYILEGDTIFKRIVWLDSDLRNELMVIYTESLNSPGYRASILTESGVNDNERISIFNTLHERALSSFTVDQG